MRRSKAITDRGRGGDGGGGGGGGGASVSRGGGSGGVADVSGRLCRGGGNLRLVNEP